MTNRPLTRAWLLFLLAWAPSATAVPVLMELPLHLATDVSGDGQVVVGWVRIAGQDFAARWTESGGVELLDIPPADGSSAAFAVNEDGSLIAGDTSEGFNAGHRDAFLWSPAGHQILAPPGTRTFYFVHGLSADGTTVVGSRGNEAFRWTSASGVEILPTVPGDSRAVARAASADGTVIVGQAGDIGNIQAARWTAAGLEILGDFGGPLANEASGITPDGTVIVGSAYTADGVQEAFRWTEDGGLVGLGTDFDFGTYALDVSADGNRIVGVSRRNVNTAFLWDSENGLQLLETLLTDGYGLDLSGWDLNRRLSISDDGLTITGSGRGPSGGRTWLLRLDPGPIPNVTNPPPPVPEPSTLAVLLCAVAALARERGAPTTRR